MGRFDEGVAEGKRAVELDPLSPIIGADLGIALFKARRVDESLAQLERVTTLDQNFSVTNWYLGAVYHALGRYAEAVAAYRKALAADDNPWVKAQLIRSLARSGERNEALEWLDELEKNATHRVVSSASLALAYGSLGQMDKAFGLLEKEVAERNSRPPLFAVNPIFDDLRGDPRFAALIKKVEQSKLD
jgi:tetratricopeptide (TPR) repeat protein